MIRFTLRPRFTLRTLFVVVSLLAVLCAWFGWQYRIVAERKAMIIKLYDMGGAVGFWPPQDPSQLVPWYRRVLGDFEVNRVLIPFSMRDRSGEIKAVFGVYTEVMIAP